MGEAVSNTSELPKLSIVVPSYNQADMLEECLTTILKQDYPNLEVLVIDGLSADHTPQIVEKYSDLVTEFVSEKDSGQPEAVTKGLGRATGDVVHWHAADDVILPGAFHAVAEHFASHPGTDLVFSDGMGFMPETRRVTFGATRRWITFEDMALFFGRFQSDCAYWRHRITPDGLPLDDSKPLMCDEDFFWRMWPGHVYRWIPHRLGAWRNHTDQVSKRVDPASLEADRADTQHIVREKMGWSDDDVRALKRRHYLRHLLLNRIGVKAHSGLRRLWRYATFDAGRKRYARWFYDEWLKPMR